MRDPIRVLVLGTGRMGSGVAVRKEDPELRDAFDKAIDAIRADGTYDKIRSAHFNFDIYGE